MCRYELQDTIVHFGELGKVPFPLNWEGITPLIPKADLIICLGTSLQVLKSYKMLWPDAGSHTKVSSGNWFLQIRRFQTKLNHFLSKLYNILI